MNTQFFRKMSLWTLTLLMVVSVLASCATPTPQVVEKEVEKVVTQIVKETVKETVIVKGTPEVVEKEVTRIVEKEVTPEKEMPVRGGTLTYSIGGAPIANFDPYNLRGNTQPIRDEMYDNLIVYKYDPETMENKLVPRLAESWEVSDDGKTLILHLRKGVKFHNGDELKAEHIVWNFERARDPERGQHMAPQMSNLESARALDDYTVEVKYTDVAHGKFDALYRLEIIHPDSVPDLDKTGIGTGPFKFGEWVPGDHLTLVRFEDYWEMGADGKPLPYLDKVVYKVIEDPQVNLMNLEAGLLDLVYPITPKDMPRFAANPDFRVVSNLGAPFYLLGLKPTWGPFQDKRVRQAVAHCVDREKIVRTVHFGTTVPQCALFPWNWTYEPDLENHERCEFNLDKARALLKEAGYEDGFEFTVLVSTSLPEYVDNLLVMQRDLAEVGIDMKLEPVADFARYYSGDFQAVSAMFDYTNRDPHAAFTQGSNLRPVNSPYSIEELDWHDHYVDLINTGAEEIDRAKRKATYRELQEMVLDLSYHIIMARVVFNQVQSARVRDLDTFETGSLEFDFTRVWLSE